MPRTPTPLFFKVSGQHLLQCTIANAASGSRTLPRLPLTVFNQSPREKAVSSLKSNKEKTRE